MPTHIADRREPAGLDRFLNVIERAGNKLPDPAILFVFALLIVWVASALLAPVAFAEIDPRNSMPIRVQNLLTGAAMAAFLSNMVTVFVTFPPLGIVLVALLGVGVAEHVGLLTAMLRGLLNITPRRLLTPMLILVGCLSHTTADAGYVLVIPLGGVIFYAAGRHPVAGIAAAFAGVSGGFSANPLPSPLDPLLQGFTQTAAQLIAPERIVNPLANYYFTVSSTLLVMGLGWFITDRVIEPRLHATPVDADEKDLPKLDAATAAERRALTAALLTMAGLLALLAVLAARDVIAGMTKAMGTMSYYIVLAFFAALFTDAFGRSNLGALFALKGATFLQALGLSGQVTIVGIIAVSAMVNLLIGSASAKWALLAPIFVPMLMQVDLAPELTQAAYRVGDSTTNIITPLMPYFPLVVVFCQRYVKHAGIGTLASLMLPYSVTFLIAWTIYLLAYWYLGIPLGVQSTYTHP